MASQGYKDWLKAGKPYTLIRPAKSTQATLRAYGLTVYDYPNDAHLQANTPEDHTPFSVTGWPGQNARWKARALDVMPRSDSAAHRRENADIARQLIRDRDAGHPGAMWIKYLNWTDEGGKCHQERWTDSANPNRRTTRDSSDKGHIHISGRSDADTDTRADAYDPIRRMAGIDTPIGVPMGQQVVAYGFGETADEQAQHWIVDGVWARRVPLDFVYGGDGKVNGPVTNVQTHQNRFLGNLGNDGQPFRSGGDVRVWGQPIGEEIHLDVDALAKTLVAAVVEELRDRDAAASITAEDIADLLAARLRE